MSRGLVCAVLASATIGAALASAGTASAPPVGPLPSGPHSMIQTTVGELVSVALPHRAGGRVWRLARTVNGKILREVSEADVGPQVVLVYKATGPGAATLSFGLTRGETAKAYESRRYVVDVRS